MLAGVFAHVCMCGCMSGCLSVCVYVFGGLCMCPLTYLCLCVCSRVGVHVCACMLGCPYEHDRAQEHAHCGWLCAPTQDPKTPTVDLTAPTQDPAAPIWDPTAPSQSRAQGAAPAISSPPVSQAPSPPRTRNLSSSYHSSKNFLSSSSRPWISVA